MATMNISVTDPMRAWVDSKVRDGEYATASDCLRDLLRERMQYEAKLASLKHEVRKGFESGRSELGWEELIEQIRTRASELSLG